MKQYIIPQTDEQSIATCQLICGSVTIDINDDPLNGGSGAGEIVYGE
ncbi:MAG: hypothetical protein MJZ64_07020 [Paludibacteraceae bacterium]|nr:hypothetical protein [Paludibacteraceae bacterium]